MNMTEPALFGSSVHVSRVGMRRAVLGKSGLASPDAPIAGAVSALRATVARARSFFSHTHISSQTLILVFGQACVPYVPYLN